MKTPTFTAEATLYRTKGRYVSFAASTSAPEARGAQVVAPASVPKWVACGITTGKAAWDCAGQKAITPGCWLSTGAAAAACGLAVGDSLDDVWDAISGPGPVQRVNEWVERKGRELRETD